jgi:hypothetical protein
MAAVDIWTIKHESGGSNGEDLNDCIILRTATYTELLSPEGVPLAPRQDKVEPPITFELFTLPDAKDIKFTLTINRFDYGLLRDEAHGPWNSIDKDNVPEDGHWTGQAGGGLEAKAEKAASADTSY